ncbi:MAG: M28 family peptidase [Bacteroidota bacterium]
MNTSPSVSPEEDRLASRLEGHVRALAEGIGERHLFLSDSLDASLNYLSQEFRQFPCRTWVQEYDVRGKRVANLEATFEGTTPGESLVVGAHYDSVPGSPGADDNASGVAALIEIARWLSGGKSARTVKLVAFVNEEPPFFRYRYMGSRVYAREARARGEKIRGMLSLETIGYYTDARGSQKYPFPFSFFYPDRGNFIGFVSNIRSRNLVRNVVKAFRRHTRFPCEWVAAPGWIMGIGWSDHWSFWREGYSAVMVTDTALFRYPHYHARSDTPEKLNYPATARVVDGLMKATTDLAENRI